MDEKKRQLRRTAAEEFMRSLEQLGELLSTEEASLKVTPDADPSQENDHPEDDNDELLSEMLKDMFSRSPEDH
jgi:hypothetical protein